MSTNTNPIIVGLDIGTTKIVAIAGRKNKHNKLEILGYGKADSAGVNHGMVQNIDQCIRSINAAIDNCRENNPNLTLKDVYVGIAGHHIKSIPSRGEYVRQNGEELITQEDVEMLISIQEKSYMPDGDEIISVIPREFTVDNATNVHQPIGMAGVKLGANFHIITGSKTDIKNIKRCVDKSGLRTVDLVLQPLASAAAVMNNEDLEAGVAVVDIGGGTTDMAVFYDGILQHTAVIPYAGTNITEDIKTGLGVLRAQAELMKIEFGTALPSETQANKYITIPGLRGLASKEISQHNLACIINARMQEIFEFVTFHLKNINLDKKLHGGIILTGGGSKLPHILQLCQFVTGLDTRQGMPVEHLAGEHSELFANPIYATSIGLILRGYSDYEAGKFGQGADMYVPLDLEDELEEVAETKQAGKTPTIDMSMLNEAEREAEEEAERVRRREKAEKTRKNINKIFSGLKEKFMSIFEDDQDTKLN